MANEVADLTDGIQKIQLHEDEKDQDKIVHESAVDMMRIVVDHENRIKELTDGIDQLMSLTKMVAEKLNITKEINQAVAPEPAAPRTSYGDDVSQQVSNSIVVQCCKDTVTDLLKTYTRLPYFYGDGKILPPEYISEFEKSMKIYKTPPQDWARIFPANVRAKSSVTWNEKNHDFGNDYNGLKKLFLNCFWTREIQQQSLWELKREDLRRCSHNEIEAVTIRWIRRMKSLNLMNFDLPQIIALAIEKLPFEYTRSLINEDPTEEELLDSIRRVVNRKRRADELKSYYVSNLNYDKTSKKVASNQKTGSETKTETESTEQKN